MALVHGRGVRRREVEGARDRLRLHPKMAPVNGRRASLW